LNFVLSIFRICRFEGRPKAAERLEAAKAFAEQDERAMGAEVHHSSSFYF
jgi:hypothetical protein